MLTPQMGGVAASTARLWLTARPRRDHIPSAHRIALNRDVHRLRGARESVNGREIDTLAIGG